MENKRPLFSLIIPCHNPEKTIDRLFDSLTKQYIDKNALEIIVVDDNSDSLEYRKKIKEYGFNLIFTETDTDIHCPGNTRRAGMPFVKGEWLFFCDQDDFFEEGSLLKIRDYINQHNNKPIYVISTIMRRYDTERNQFVYEYPHKQAWLHGKWYSVDNLIVPYNINFKKDLESHEDVYFNNLVLSVLFELNTDWNYFDIYTYRWVDNPDSITRTQVYPNKRGYLYDYFQDYMDSSLPYWDKVKTIGTEVFINQIMMTLLHAYFYYEEIIYLKGKENYIDVFEIIEKYIFNIINDLNLSPDFIVNYVYSDALKYNKVMQECIMKNWYIPDISFKDFVYQIAQKNKSLVN